MNKINAKIRIAELDGLSDSIVRIYKANSAVQADAFLKGAFSELETLSAQITTAILQDKTVSSLDEVDSARDEALRSLGAVLAGYASFPVAEKKSAGIEMLFAQLRSAQDSFTAANDEYVKTVASKGVSATSLKKPLLSVINDKIVSYLNLMQGNDVLADFSKSIEKEIARVNNSLQKREKAKK